MAGPVCVLAGGVGAARFLVGLQAAIDPGRITAVVNTADDDVLHGLAISPDLDTVVYTTTGAIDPGRGWGLASETWAALEAMRRIAAAAGREDLGWFQLGDRDLGTHLYRTTRLGEGASLSEVTAEIAAAFGVAFTVLPVTDERIATRVVTDRLGELSFQEYFVREHHDVAATSVEVAGAGSARPAPGVLEAVAAAATDGAVVVAPSNPLVSIGPLLAVGGVREAVAAARERVVAVSPIVGGRALKGPADRLLVELGHEASVVGVARLYAPLASVLVVDEVDAGSAAAVEAEGMRCVVTPTVMAEPGVAVALARTCVAAVTGEGIGR